MQNNKSTILGAVSASMYVSFQVIANVLSTKIALLPFINWPIDGGTVIYPLTFTLRDFVHKTLGKKNARSIVLLAGAINVVMVLLFVLVGKMAPDSSWPFQEAYNNILLPVWRITAASIVSQIISELVDTEIFSWAFQKFSDTTAVLFSNTVALVVDSFMFSFLAFFGQMPVKSVLQIVVTNIVIKMIMSLVSVPTIKLVPRQVEMEDI